MGVNIEAYREILAGHHSRMANSELSDRMNNLAADSVDQQKYPLLKKAIDREILTPAEATEAEKQGEALSQQIDSDTERLSDLLIRRSQQGSLNAQDTQKLTELKNKFSRDYNIPQDQLNQQIDQHAAWLDQNKSAVPRFLNLIQRRGSHVSSDHRFCVRIYRLGCKDG